MHRRRQTNNHRTLKYRQIISDQDKIVINILQMVRRIILKNNMNRVAYALILISGLVLFSCTDPSIITEAKIDAPNDYWAQKTQMDFPFEVSDPNATYKLFYQIRYDN